MALYLRGLKPGAQAMVATPGPRLDHGGAIGHDPRGGKGTPCEELPA